MAGFDKVLGQKQGVMIPDTAVAKGATDFSSSIEATGKLVTDTFEGVVVNDFLSDSTQLETQVVNTPDNRVEGNVESKETTFSNKILGAKNIVSALNQGKLSKSAARSRIQSRLRTAINENPAHEAALIKAAEKTLGLGGGSGGSGGGGIFDESNEEKFQRKREESLILAEDKKNREDLANANLLGKTVPEYKELQQIIARQAEVSRQKELAINEMRVGGIESVGMQEDIFNDQMGALLLEASTAKPDGVYSVEDQVTLTNSAEQIYNTSVAGLREEVKRYPADTGLREDVDARIKVMSDSKDEYIKSVKSGASLEFNRDRLTDLQNHGSVQEFQKSAALAILIKLYGAEYMAKGNTRYKQMLTEIRNGKNKEDVVVSVEDQRFWNAYDPLASEAFAKALQNPSTLPSADELTKKVALTSAAGVIATLPPSPSKGAEATEAHVATVSSAMTLPLTEGQDYASLLSLNTASARQAFAESPALRAQLVNRVGTLFGDIQREANDLRISPNSYRWELSKDEQGKSKYSAKITGDLSTKQRQAVEDMETTINGIYIPMLNNHPETLGTQTPEDLLNSLNEKAVGTIPNEQDKLDTATSNLEEGGFEVKQERGFFELTDKNGEFYNPAVDAVKGAIKALIKTQPISIANDLRKRFSKKLDELEKDKGVRAARHASRVIERDASLVQDFFEEPTEEGANAVIRNADTTTKEEQQIANDYLTAIESGATVSKTPSGGSGGGGSTGGFGKRTDGTEKGSGYLGEIPNLVNGGTMTELSVNFEDVLEGKLIPLIVPTLTEEEVATLQNIDIGSGEGTGDVPKAILRKAIDHARLRDSQGLSPFNESEVAPITPAPDTETAQSFALPEEGAATEVSAIFDDMVLNRPELADDSVFQRGMQRIKEFGEQQQRAVGSPIPPTALEGPKATKLEEANVKTFTPEVLALPPIPQGTSKGKHHFKGEAAVREIEKREGELSLPMKRIVKLEGFVDVPYEDTKGVVTIGVGQTGEFMGKSFKESFAAHEDRARKILLDYDEYPEEVQAELIQGVYRGDVTGSPNFIEFMNVGEYARASKEFLDNNEYKSSKTPPSIKDRMESISKAVASLTTKYS